MHKLLTTILLFSLTLTLQSQQRPLGPEGIVKLKAGVKAASAGTTTISSDFTQEKSMQIMQDKLASKGKFCFKKEKKLRWEYTTPYSYLIIINNDRITVKDEQKTSDFNMQTDKVFSEINNIIMGSVRGTLLADEKNFSITFFETGNAYIARLKPLSPKMKGSLNEIVIWFDKNRFFVTKLEMTEPNKDSTVITFTDIKLNIPIADEMFVIH
jgi:outer membrane lipoprotein-sorting protein